MIYLISCAYLLGDISPKARGTNGTRFHHFYMYITTTHTALRPHKIQYMTLSPASICGTKQYIYCSDICTSSSPPAGGWAEPDAVVEAEAGGGGSSLGCIVWRYASMRGPSSIRKSTAVLGTSCTPPGPSMPIEVLFGVSSLSCCNVSRSACKPWRIRSSRLPVMSGSHMNTSVSQNRTEEGKEEVRYSRQRTQSASRGTSWRFGYVRRSKRQSTRTRCHSVRTRINVGLCGRGR